jgi:hypothetical protein
MKEKYAVPLIKEHRVSKLVDAIECIDRYPFNREKQKECILNLYSEKTEKSVFRGMVIPSLRSLGLIIGYGAAIRLSGNGRLILEGRKHNKEEEYRIARTIFLEIDQNVFHLVEQLKQRPNISEERFIELVSTGIQAVSERQKKERVKRWLEILKGCELIRSIDRAITIHEENYKHARRDLEIEPKRPFFKSILFVEYKSLPSQETAGIIDIAALREHVALSYYRKHDMILTESQFDELLRSFPLVTDNYAISLGQPMGAEEKLFFFKGNYYRTLSITFFQRERME